MYTANKTFYEWSDGLFVSEAAAEAFTVTHIAQAIMHSDSPPPYLQLECPIRPLIQTHGVKKKGRFKARTSGNSRLDIAVFNATHQLKFAVEVKCTCAWDKDTYLGDVRRLKNLFTYFHKRHEQTALQAGLFAMFLHVKSKESEEVAKDNLIARRNDWKIKIKDYCDKYKEENIALSFSDTSKMHIVGDGEDMATSFSLYFKTSTEFWLNAERAFASETKERDAFLA